MGVSLILTRGMNYYLLIFSFLQKLGIYFEKWGENGDRSVLVLGSLCIWGLPFCIRDTEFRERFYFYVTQIFRLIGKNWNNISYCRD